MTATGPAAPATDAIAPAAGTAAEPVVAAGHPLAGKVVEPGDDDYDAARRVWNKSIDKRPALVVRCASTDDVVAAVRLARERGLEIAVRGGGHSFVGHSTTDGGLVIDLAGMRELRVDPEARLLTAGPGLRWDAVADATVPHGLAAVGGHVANVGVAGLTLGGGNGWLSRLHGLACDNLVAADVVTAAGDVVHVSDDEHPDLMWALRGGGGNFGVVVRLTLRLHPVGATYAGMAIHPADNAATALRLLAELRTSAPPQASVAAAVCTAPPAPFVPAELRGRPCVMLAGAWFGDVADGERALAPLREVGPPAVAQFGPMSFVELQHFFDANGVSSHFHLRSHLVDTLDDAAIATLLAGALAPTSPMSAVIVLPMGGAIAGVAPDATPFHHRGAGFCLEIASSWDGDDEPREPHRAWADAIYDAMQPWCTGAEVNHIGDEGDERVRFAYGPNHARLAAAKRAWDPDNVFRLNQNIAPA